VAKACIERAMQQLLSQKNEIVVDLGEKVRNLQSELRRRLEGMVAPLAAAVGTTATALSTAVDSLGVGMSVTNPAAPVVNVALVQEAVTTNSRTIGRGVTKYRSETVKKYRTVEYERKHVEERTCGSDRVWYTTETRRESYYTTEQIPYSETEYSTVVDYNVNQRAVARIAVGQVLAEVDRMEHQMIGSWIETANALKEKVFKEGEQNVRRFAQRIMDRAKQGERSAEEQAAAVAAHLSLLGKLQEYNRCVDAAKSQLLVALKSAATEGKQTQAPTFARPSLAPAGLNLPSVAQQGSAGSVTAVDPNQIRVGLIGLASSGKSTVANAIIGSSLLPSNALPATAGLTKIVNCPRGNAKLNGEPLSLPCAFPNLSVSSYADIIFDDTIYTNEPVRREQAVCGSVRVVRAAIEEFNKANRSRKEPIPCHVFVHGVSPLLQKFPGLQLHDLPGSNDLMVQSGTLRSQIAISGRINDLVIYVMDATHFRRSGDKEAVMAHLQYSVKDELLQRNTGAAIPLLVIVNKVDSIEEAKYQQLCDEAHTFVCDSLRSLKSGAEVLFPKSQVLCLCARDIVLSDAYEAGELDEGMWDCVVRETLGSAGGSLTPDERLARVRTAIGPLLEAGRANRERLVAAVELCIAASRK
jgi:hypothetical protein